MWRIAEEPGRKDLLGPGIGEELDCPICSDSIVVDPKVHLWALCCKRKSWFHRECVQQLANTAGKLLDTFWHVTTQCTNHYTITANVFKCPLCNNQGPGADPSRGRQQRMSGMCYA